MFRVGFVGWATVYLLATKWFAISFNLLTYKLLILGMVAFEPNRVTDLKSSDPESFSSAQTSWMNRFESVGHCLFALFFGLIGGWVTLSFYRKRQMLLGAPPKVDQ